MEVYLWIDQIYTNKQTERIIYAFWQMKCQIEILETFLFVYTLEGNAACNEERK